MAFPNSLNVLVNGNVETFEFTDKVLSVKPSGKKLLHIPIRNVVGARVKGDHASVSFLRERNKGVLTLVHVGGHVKLGEEELAHQWVDALIDEAYRGVQQRKRLKIIVNPFGGKGKAAQMYNKHVEPILHAAGCHTELLYTTHQGHAKEVAQHLDLDHYDAIVLVSGDGVIHEVFNGLSQHKLPRRALQIPIAPIPAGSGNGLCLNLLGLKSGFDAGTAALNVLKGHKTKIDLMSIVQGGKRTLSFMSQTLGLMADADIGTDHLRWMGSTRFAYGYLRGVVAFKPCPVELSIKVVHSDKLAMIDDWMSRSEKHQVDKETAADNGFDGAGEDDALVPLKYTLADAAAWVKVTQPVSFCNAGKGPFLGPDYMAFPISLANDGYIDIVVQELSSRMEHLTGMSDAPKGGLFWQRSTQYYKAQAYHIKPLTKQGLFAVDGEAFPFEESIVEVHPGLGTVLSPQGRYAIEFDPSKRHRGPSGV